jgi:large subunit ribosomal protein L11
MSLDLVLKCTLTIYIRAQMAESGPPLGTVLGNWGVNAVKFCKDFNESTLDLPSYFNVKVTIFVYENNTYSFVIKLPSMGSIISLLIFERQIKYKGKEITQQCITWQSVVQLALFKLPGKDLKIAIPIVLGSVNAFKKVIVI